MDNFEIATEFFHACESLQGWEGCKEFVDENAVFFAQSEPLEGIETVKDYCEWMSGLGSHP